MLETHILIQIVQLTEPVSLNEHKSEKETPKDLLELRRLSIEALAKRVSEAEGVKRDAK